MRSAYFALSHMAERSSAYGGWQFLQHVALDRAERKVRLNSSSE